MNETRFTKGFTVGLAMLAAAALGACKGNDRYAADSASAARDSAAGRIDTTHRADSLAAADTANKSGWAPAAVIAYMAASDNSEIKEGTLVEKKAINAQVKAFGRQLVTDHKAGLAEAKSLASKMSVTIDSTNSEAMDLTNKNNDDYKDLTDAKAGKDWDKKFLDHAIDDHQHVLDKLQDAAKNTTDPQLRAAIEKTTGKVQEHLTKAQDLKAKLDK